MVKIMGLKKEYVFDKTSLLWYSLSCWWNSPFDESLSHGWKHITLKKIHHFGEHSSVWWKFITLMKTYHLVKISSLLWKFVTLMKIHYFDENSSHWWIIPNLLNIDCFVKRFITFKSFYENTSLWKKNHHFSEN